MDFGRDDRKYSVDHQSTRGKMGLGTEFPFENQSRIFESYINLL